jgi:hypothetical protein
MEARLADATGAPVSVKGRRAEGLGAIGRGEGIACWAVAWWRGRDAPDARRRGPRAVPAPGLPRA